MGCAVSKNVIAPLPALRVDQPHKESFMPVCSSQMQTRLTDAGDIIRHTATLDAQWLYKSLKEENITY